MTKQTFENFARVAYFTYGYLPLLRVLQIYEQREQFDVCAQIKKALNEYCEGYPHQYSTEAIEVVKDDLHKQGADVAQYFGNFGMYVVECRKFIDTNSK